MVACGETRREALVGGSRQGTGRHTEVECTFRCFGRNLVHPTLPILGGNMGGKRRGIGRALGPCSLARATYLCVAVMSDWHCCDLCMKPHARRQKTEILHRHAITKNTHKMMLSPYAAIRAINNHHITKPQYSL